MAMNTYVIHATCRYVVQNKKTKACENGQSRPTISVDASSEAAAIRKATKQMKDSYASDYWPVISFHLSPELVRVIEHPTPAQLRVLRVFAGGRQSGANKGMLRRLVDKGWLEGPMLDGYKITPAGRSEVS
jgi:hypothetical protein